MNVFKRQCIDLRKRDYTLSEIVRITGRPKTSVHFHIRAIPLSAAKRRSISESSAARAREVALKRRGLSARNFRKFPEWDADMVSLVAHFLFDGEIKHAGCYYHNRNRTLLQHVESRMKAVYNLEPKRYKNHTTGVSRICYFNVSLAAYIREKSTELLQGITRFPRDLKREFIKSFFDDEGCVDFRVTRNLRQIRGYQKNTKILYLIQNLLADFKIGSRVILPNETVISGKENLTKFQREINFSPGVRINGKRSNSIWKQSLEKRVLLERAIDSFKPVGSNGVHRR